MLVFGEAYQRMTAENVANWHTPGYKAKHLDVPAFQKALRRALDDKGGDANKALAIRSSRQLGRDADGRLRVTPTTEPVDNVLFHDGTNGSIERMMSGMAKNAMRYEAAAALLKGHYDGLRKAIRGTVG
jgi:flagellar basal-body rod protein FlgB